MTNGGSLIGLVSDIQVYNRLLSDEEAYRYMDCSEILSGDIAAWEDDQDWKMVGEIVTVEMESQASSMESVYDSEEEANIYEELHEDIPDDVTVYEDIDSDDSDQQEREKSFQEMKSIIKVNTKL